MRTYILVVGLIGCGETAAFRDATIPDAFPDQIQISGVASSRGSADPTPLVGISVGVYSTADVSNPIATTETDSSGMYKLIIPTHGAPVSAFLHASSPGYIDTYRLFDPPLYLAYYPWEQLDMVTPAAYAQLYSMISGGRIDGTATLELDVTDAGRGPVSDAKITTRPTATELGTPDHLTFILNAPPDLYVQTTSSSYTYPDRELRGFADAITLATLVADVKVEAD